MPRARNHIVSPRGIRPGGAVAAAAPLLALPARGGGRPGPARRAGARRGRARDGCPGHAVQATAPLLERVVSSYQAG